MAVKQTPQLFNKNIQNRRSALYEGKNKVLFESSEPHMYIMHFKNGAEVGGAKGVINNRISELLMARIANIGIETHLVRRVNMFEQLIRAAEPLLFSVQVTNVMNAPLAEKLMLTEGEVLRRPWIEFHIKNKKNANSLLSEQHLISLDWAREEEIEEITQIVQRINDYLSGMFLGLNIRLESFTLEFGRVYNTDFPEFSKLILIDELSPDTMSLRDLKDNIPLGPAIEALQPQKIHWVYQEVASRLGLLHEGGPADLKTVLTDLS